MSMKKQQKKREKIEWISHKFHSYSFPHFIVLSIFFRLKIRTKKQEKKQQRQFRHEEVDPFAIFLTPYDTNTLYAQEHCDDDIIIILYLQELFFRFFFSSSFSRPNVHKCAYCVCLFRIIVSRLRCFRYSFYLSVTHFGHICDTFIIPVKFVVWN